MKPLEQRQEYIDYMGGKQMPASSFMHGALDIFSDHAWEDAMHRDKEGRPAEHCARQLSFPIEGFYGDVFYTKSRPIEIKSGETIHLQESRPLINGVTKLI